MIAQLRYYYGKQLSNNGRRHLGHNGEAAPCTCHSMTRSGIRIKRLVRTCPRQTYKAPVQDFDHLE